MCPRIGDSKPEVTVKLRTSPPTKAELDFWFPRARLEVLEQEAWGWRFTSVLKHAGFPQVL